MQMRRWRRFGSLLVLAVCTLVASSALGRPGRAAVGVPPGAKITKIGPQEVVIEHADGYISKYDDPSQQERECTSTAACASKALAALGVFGALVYEELTTNVEGGGAPAGPNGAQ